MSDSPSVQPLVLLVEDNDTIRDAFAILLEESGYRVAQAATGAEALDVARSDRVDLILLDVGLPDLDGLEVTRRLKADPATRDAFVIALTGRTLETDQEACMAAGCDGFLAKPIGASALLEAVKRGLSRE